MNLPVWSLPLVGWVPLALTMVWAWRRQRRTGNAGIVDGIWTLGIGGLAVLYAVLAPGWWPRRLAVGLLVGLWSMRLFQHLAARMGREQEDPRYRQMREEMGANFDRNMVWFFQAQALLAVLLSSVFLAIAAAPHPGWRWQDWAGLALAAAALAGESLADRQLEAFRSDPATEGKTCRRGLWRYSRHPNYFCEWLLWVAYALIAWGLPYGWCGLLCAATMLFLVLKVTGIPPAERSSLKSRPEDYRRYQQETNAFFPGPPKEAGA